MLLRASHSPLLRGNTWSPGALLPLHHQPPCGCLGKG